MRQITTQDFDSNGTIMEREVFHEYDTKNRSKRIITEGSGGVEHISEFRYADNYVSEYPDLNISSITEGVYYGEITDPRVGILRELVKRNHNSPIEQLSYLKKPNEEKVLIQAKFLEYAYVSEGMQYLPSMAYVMELGSSANMNSSPTSFVSSDGILQFGNYVERGKIDKYDGIGNILQYSKVDHNPVSFIWDKQGLNVTAKIENAEESEVFYTGFENINDGSSSGNGNWLVTAPLSEWIGNNIMNSKTGLHHLAMSPTVEVKAYISKTKTYKLSFWFKGAGVTIEKTGSIPQQTGIGNDWTYYTSEVQLTNGDVLKLTGSSNSTWIDELKLRPVGAIMETYGYDPKNRKMVTSNTVNDIMTYYEYDKFNRLEYVRDHNRNIIQNYEYIYHNEIGSGNRNQVWGRTVLKEGLINKTSFISEFNLLDGNEKSVNVQYLDEYGRPQQEISVAQSVNSHKDIISFHKYDELGREDKQYLSFVGTNNTGGYNLHPEVLQEAWYASNPENTPDDKKIAETAFPYAQTIFDSSPLGRTLEQGSQGEDWQVGSEHTKRMEYTGIVGFDYGLFVLLNPSGQQAYTTAYGSIGIIDFQSETGTSFSWYSKGEIMKTITNDENNHETHIFTDKQGRIILVRKFLTDNAGISKAVDTYNVYNDFGLLEAVIPPEAVEYMKSNGNWNYTDKAIFGGWCYYYEYDHRLRLSAKELPGAGRTEYYYDKRDQLVLVQDANQQSTTPQTGSFTKYDQLGRPIQTGIYTIPVGMDIQAEIESAGMPNERHISSFADGYTNQAFPTGNRVYHTHTFYDDYDFNNDGVDEVDYIPNQGAGIILPSDYFERLDGQLTATKVRYEDNGVTKWLTTATFYDERMRNIQVRSQHHLGYWNTNSATHDFANKVLTTKRMHQGQTGEYSGYLEHFDYYDNGNLKNVRYKAKDDQEYIRSRNVYNDLGQLMEKNLHSDLSANSFLQSIDYRYNIRGWLTAINDTHAPSDDGEGNRLSFASGGTYVIGFNKIDTYKLQVTIGKLMKITRRGTIPQIDSEDSKVLVLDIPMSRTLPDLSNITMNLDNIADVSDATDIPESFDKLLLEVSNELDARFVGGFESIKKPIITELVDIAKSTWYLAKTGYDLDTDDLYKQRLYYNHDDANLGSAAQYNGNISSTIWQINGKERQAYGFEYDDMDRLVKANYRAITETDIYHSDNDYSVPQISYDLNGNILSLKRNEKDMDPFIHLPSVLDELSYTYEQNSNRLLGVQDAGNVSKGFVDGINYSIEYTYDANGNMIEDKNKGLEITYNHMNLPTNFIWDDPSTTGIDKEIRILYYAIGVKLKKTIIQNFTGGLSVPNIVKDYVGGIEYKNGELEAVYHTEGRCVPKGDYVQYTQNDDIITDGAFVYEYTIRDHLGNSRLTFADLNNDGSIEVNHDNPSETEIIQESHYYPFGLEMDIQTTQFGTPNKYMYNGKELSNDFGLNLSDYGARWYDASIGRWHSIDPLAEKYNSFSSYNYVINNPLKFIDPDGKDVEEVDEGYKLTGEDAKTAFGLLISSSKNNSKGFGFLNLFVASTSRDDKLETSYLIAKIVASVHPTLMVLEVNSASDLVSQMEQILFPINNVIIDSHGSYNQAQFSIGGTLYSTPGGIRGGTNIQRVGELMNGNIILLACFSGAKWNEGPQLIQAVAESARVTVYAPQSHTVAAKLFYANPSSQIYSYTQRSTRAKGVGVAGKWSKAHPTGINLNLSWNLSLSPTGHIVTIPYVPFTPITLMPLATFFLGL